MSFSRWNSRDNQFKSSVPSDGSNDEPRSSLAIMLEARDAINSKGCWLAKSELHAMKVFLDLEDVGIDCSLDGCRVLKK